MTIKEAQKKIATSKNVCYWAHGLFSALEIQYSNTKEHILKENFLEGVYDLSLRDIAKLMDTIEPNGGSIPKEYRDILA